MGRIITLTGSSGAGKSSIVKELLRLSHFRIVQSTTTRSSRSSDMPDEYRYISMEHFLQQEQENLFAWTTGLVHGNRYGTEKIVLDRAKQSPHHSLMILVPEVVPVLRNYAPGQADSFYLLSPGAQELRQRLERRGDSPATIEQRIEDCLTWDIAARESKIPYRFIENAGSLSNAVRQILSHY